MTPYLFTYLFISDSELEQIYSQFLETWDQIKHCYGSYK